MLWSTKFQSFFITPSFLNVFYLTTVDQERASGGGFLSRKVRPEENQISEFRIKSEGIITHRTGVMPPTLAC